MIFLFFLFSFFFFLFSFFFFFFLFFFFFFFFFFLFFFFFGTNAPSPSYPSLLLYHASVSAYQDPSTKPASISNSPRVTFVDRAKRSQKKCEFRATVDGTVETHQEI